MTAVTENSDVSSVTSMVKLWAEVELSVEVAVRSGEFLVICGSVQADSGFLLGSWWLTSTLDLEQYETVLFVSAQPKRIVQ